MLRLDRLHTKRFLNLALRLSSLNLGGVYLARGTRIYADVAIGQGTRINGAAVIKGHATVRIGKFCAIGDNLKLITSNHYLHYLAVQNNVQRRILGMVPVGEKRGIKVGHDVWVGDSVIVLPGVEIGHGAVIGAGSIVTRSVDAYSVMAGNPASKVRMRFESEIIDLLLDLKWWDWSFTQMKERKDLFSLDFSKVSADQLQSKIKAMPNADR